MSTTHEHIYGAQPDREKRPVWRAMARGFRGRCPSCGTGSLFSSFGKSVESCANCAQTISHHRADDFPAYLNIFVVGHLVVPAFVIVERLVDWSIWTHLAIWVPVTIIMAVALLQPIKGAVIGLQWANYMHGFGGDDDGLARHDVDPDQYG